MKLLAFRLARERYAIAVEAVADVAAAGAVRSVPRAPRAVRGLTERRGRVLALVDVASVFEDCPVEGARPHLLSLAAPHDGTALWVPARLTAGEGAPAPDPDRPPGTFGRVFIEGEPHLLLDVESLLRRLEVA